MIGLVIALLGIALAVVLAGFGSIIAVGSVGQTSNGVMSEEPDLFGKLLLLTALPGTQGIYGFLAGFIGIFRLGLLGGGADAPWRLLREAGATTNGIEFFLACLPVALAGTRPEPSYAAARHRPVLRSRCPPVHSVSSSPSAISLSSREIQKQQIPPAPMPA